MLATPPELVRCALLARDQRREGGTDCRSPSATSGSSTEVETAGKVPNTDRQDVQDERIHILFILCIHVRHVYLLGLVPQSSGGTRSAQGPTRVQRVSRRESAPGLDRAGRVGYQQPRPAIRALNPRESVGTASRPSRHHWSQKKVPTPAIRAARRAM